MQLRIYNVLENRNELVINNLIDLISDLTELVTKYMKIVIETKLVLKLKEQDLVTE